MMRLPKHAAKPIAALFGIVAGGLALASCATFSKTDDKTDNAETHTTRADVAWVGETTKTVETPTHKETTTQVGLVPNLPSPSAAAAPCTCASPPPPPPPSAYYYRPAPWWVYRRCPWWNNSYCR